MEPIFSFAQNYEDILLLRLFKSKESGFYVDVGAAHPKKDSVTKLFYDRGWRGINIEPNPKLFTLLEKYRPADINLNLAISDKQGKVEFNIVENDEFLSSQVEIDAKLQKENQLKIRKTSANTDTLESIFAKHVTSHDIDFLKVDVEGAERLVLSSFDLTKIQPRIILVESVMPKSDISTEDNWNDLLFACGYQKVYFDGLNSYFAKKTDIEASDSFKLPLNYQDNFVKADNLKLKNVVKRIVSP